MSGVLAQSMEAANLAGPSPGGGGTGLPLRRPR